MKAAPAALVVVVTLVNGKPFDQFQTTGFSNFDPDTGTFSVGSSTNLHQENIIDKLKNCNLFLYRKELQIMQKIFYWRLRICFLKAAFQETI